MSWVALIGEKLQPWPGTQSLLASCIFLLRKVQKTWFFGNHICSPIPRPQIYLFYHRTFNQLKVCRYFVLSVLWHLLLPSSCSSHCVIELFWFSSKCPQMPRVPGEQRNLTWCIHLFLALASPFFFRESGFSIGSGYGHICNLKNWVLGKETVYTKDTGITHSCELPM